MKAEELIEELFKENANLYESLERDAAAQWARSDAVSSSVQMETLTTDDTATSTYDTRSYGPVQGHHPLQAYYKPRPVTPASLPRVEHREHECLTPDAPTPKPLQQGQYLQQLQHPQQHWHSQLMQFPQQAPYPYAYPVPHPYMPVSPQMVPTMPYQQLQSQGTAMPVAGGYWQPADQQPWPAPAALPPCTQPGNPYSEHTNADLESYRRPESPRRASINRQKADSKCLIPHVALS